MNLKPRKSDTPDIGDWIVRTNHYISLGEGKGVPHGFQNEVSGTNFDELVLGGVGTCWFHMEQLNERGWYVGIDGLQLHVTLDKQGRVKSVTMGDKGKLQE